MTPRSELFDLVQSLSSTEYSDFTDYLRHRTGKENSNPEQLIHAIRNQDSFDDDALKKQFKGKGIAKNLSSEKNNAQEYLMNWLAGNQLTEDPLNEARLWFDYARVHFKRKLGAARFLSKAKELARARCLWPLLLEILLVERRIILAGNLDKADASLDENLSTERDVLAFLDHERKLKAVADQLFLKTRILFRTKDDATDEWLGSMESVLREYEENRLPFESRRTLLNATSYLYQLKGDSKANYDTILRLISLWESEPEMAKLKMREYKLTLANFLSAGSEARNYQKFEDTLTTLQALPSKSPEEKLDTDQSMFLYKLLGALHNRQMKTAESMADSLPAWEKKFSGRMISSRRLSILFNCGTTYFVLGRFDEADTYWLRVMTDEASGHREDLRVCANLMHIITLLELKQMKFFEQAIESMRRKPSAQKYISEFEKNALNRLRSLADGKLSDDARKLRKWKTEIEAAKAEAPFRIQGLGEVLAWVTAKTEGGRMEQYI